MSEEVKDLKPEEQSKEYTEEEKQQLEDFYLTIYKKRFKGQLNRIKEYLISNNITIEDAIDEVNNKSSKLSRSCRDILIYTKLEYLKKCL